MSVVSQENPKIQHSTPNSSFHFLFHYPNITLNLLSYNTTPLQPKDPSNTKAHRPLAPALGELRSGRSGKATFSSPRASVWKLPKRFRVKGLEFRGSVWGHMGFPKMRGTILEIPIIRIIVFGCLYWGPLILGNYHMGRMLVFWGVYGGPFSLWKLPIRLAELRCKQLFWRHPSLSIAAIC